METLWRVGLADNRSDRQERRFRYSHVGEGAYDKTESMIKLLLAEES